MLDAETRTFLLNLQRQCPGPVAKAAERTLLAEIHSIGIEGKLIGVDPFAKDLLELLKRIQPLIVMDCASARGEQYNQRCEVLADLERVTRLFEQLLQERGDAQ